jgi:hypothetical protein
LLFGLAGLAVGLVILAQLGTWAWVGYLALYLLEMAAVLAFACTRCCYYGKTCGMGYDKLAALLFKKGAEEEFHTAVGFVTRPRLVCGHCKQAESGCCMMAPRRKE